MNRSLFLFCFGLLIVFGCTTPKITKRYTTHSFSTGEKSSLPDSIPHKIGASLSIFTTKIPQSTAQTTLSDLSPQAQAVFIKVLGEKNQNTEKFIDSIGKPIRAEEVAQARVDKTTVKRRIIFSVSKDTMEPADRISWLRITMLLEDNERTKFKSWNKFASEFEDIDLGKLTFTQRTKIGADIQAGFTPGTQTVGLTGKAEHERALTEEVSLTRRLVTFAGQLQPKRATFLREGASSIDLTGESVIDLDIGIEQFGTGVKITSFSNFFKEGVANPQDQVQVNTQRIYYPIALPQGVMAKVKFEYLIRHVRFGDDTITESDDAVSYVYGVKDYSLDGNHNQLLISCNDLIKYMWQIKDRDGRLLQIGPISATGATPTTQILKFSSYEDAENLLLWLHKHRHGKGTVKVAKNHLYLNQRPLTKNAISGLRIDVAAINGDCPKAL